MREASSAMFLQPLSIDQLSNVISQVTGPAFLLAAEAQLLSVLVARLDRIIDRTRQIESTPEASSGGAIPGSTANSELLVLRSRGRLMHRAIYWGVGSCVVTSFLVILGFAAAFLRVRHEYGAGILFIIAMFLFTAALIVFAREIKLGYSEIDAGAMFSKRRGERPPPYR